MIYPETPEILALRGKCRALIFADEFYPRAFSAGFKTTSIDGQGYEKYEDYGYDIFEILEATREKLQPSNRLGPTKDGHFVVDYSV